MQKATSTTSPFSALHLTGLENVHRVTEKVTSGSQPDGEKAFASLRDIGIKTIISVDGAPPDVELAMKYGLRYVHLPIEYSGVTDAQGLSIAKAITDLPGPIYLHCHHGKHSSAAAVAVACVFNGTLEPQQAPLVLSTFGTGENYRGLWTAARNAKKVDPKILADTKVDYVSIAKVPDLAETMVKIDKQMDMLRKLQKQNWKSNVNPSKEVAQTTAQILDLLAEIERTGEAREKPADFFQMLRESGKGFGPLNDSLTIAHRASTNEAFAAINQSCVKCHQKYRD